MTREKEREQEEAKAAKEVEELQAWQKVFEARRKVDQIELQVSSRI